MPRVPSLTLSIQNMDRLPDGGPLEISVKGQRGIDIGRDPYLDWTLPDPGRIVSSRHCEVRFRDGAYWLHDISSNGTFLNGSELRMPAPHRLGDGDRIEIGHYVIGAKVQLDGETAEPEAFAPPPFVQPEALWDSDSTAPPIAAAELRPPRPAAEQSDLMNWYVDIPEVDEPRRSPEPAWLAAPPPVVAEPTPIAAPAPAPVAVPAPVAAAPAPEAGFDALPPLVAEDAAPRTDWSITPLPEAPEPAPSPFASPGGYMTAPPAAIVAEIPRAEPAVLAAAPPAPAPAPPRAPAAPLPGGASLAALMARGAGVGEDVFGRRPPEEMAELAGLVLRLTCENLKQMLAARAETKGLVRSTNQTMIQALENNPLKFSPSAEDALRTMFGPPTTSYLDARRAIEDSFRDLKSHQLNTYAAMQQALKLLVEDLDPAAIENATDKESGIGGLMGSRKGKLWDHFVTRWKAKTERHDNGLVDAFMLYFSECYDRLASKLRS
jgi:type VI secretion system protein ImpI